MQLANARRQAGLTLVKFHRHFISKISRKIANSKCSTRSQGVAALTRSSACKETSWGLTALAARRRCREVALPPVSERFSAGCRVFTSSSVRRSCCSGAASAAARRWPSWWEMKSRLFPPNLLRRLPRPCYCYLGPRARCEVVQPQSLAKCCIEDPCISK